MTVERRFTRAVIIGAGFSGIATAYPGCGVDVPAVLYSLSFAPNPNFSRLFPDQEEILDYLGKVAEDYDVPSHIEFGASWESAHWQEASKTWLLKLRMVESGETIEHECKVLIAAVGRLVHPKPLEISGVQDFKGQIIHSAEWRRDVTLKDKNVTPQYYIPKPLDHWRITNRAKLVFRYVPGVFKLLRVLVFVYLEWTFRQFYLDESATKLRKRAQLRSKRYVEKTAPKKYWELLSPKYAIGCKRRILDPGYLKSLHRENVELTDDTIVSLSESDLITKSGRHYPTDVIIVANGFDAFEYHMTVVGRQGQTLEDHWRGFGGMEAYKTTALADFPNFFLLSGPNSVGGHNSSLFSIERVINLILKIAKPVLTGEIDYVEVKRSAEKKWTEDAQAALKDRVYSDNCATVGMPFNCSPVEIPISNVALVLRGSEDPLELL
ncbi:hypothetical protein N0V83_000043 [Neocucurbitaria cava]|uniref:Flavin-containing monooxygenase n=1 Tax=Neocucurbitaria cava TaxID=798079 RepID=A0A9W8YIM2_9PLEO|nr:hypothetical protein N0V83_000043 [Neocucurbitaria cava]